MEQEPKNWATMAPVILAPDGITAYFNKAVLIKPKYGIFSKKRWVHKVFKAVYDQGAWQQPTEVTVAPKNANAIHPSVSPDGKRLFFASDMPGTYGEFDIYVAEIQPDGTYGTSKNLGPKVNTKTNDLFPNITEGNLLYYASNGRNGFGGLDVYLAQVADRKVSRSVHLDRPINSEADDYSLVLLADKGMGYVMSTRYNTQTVGQPLAFTYTYSKGSGAK